MPLKYTNWGKKKEGQSIACQKAKVEESRWFQSRVITKHGTIHNHHHLLTLFNYAYINYILLKTDFFTQLASNCSVPPLFYSNGSSKATQITGPWNPSNPTATCISTHNQKEHPHQDQSTILVKVKIWFEFIFSQKKKRFGFLIFLKKLLSQLYHSHLFFQYFYFLLCFGLFSL
jgi:hypothetical protein